METGREDEQDWPTAAGGDPGAFARIFDRHADLVYRFARRRTGDPWVAEDITSQVFLEAWRQRDRVQLLNGSLRSWLLGVAANLVRRHWRSAGRRGRALARFPLPELHPDPADEVAHSLDAAERLSEVRRVITQMPHRQRDVLLLWAWEGLGYAEIAAVLGIPVGTVRSRLSRARARIGAADGTESADGAYTIRQSEDGVPDGLEGRAR